EHVGEPAAAHERLLGGDGDRALARSREPREPDRHALLSEQLLAVGARDVLVVPGDVGRLLLGHGPFRRGSWGSRTAQGSAGSGPGYAGCAAGARPARCARTAATSRSAAASTSSGVVKR